MSIKVIIAGFKGKMGQAAYKMVTEDSELELVGLLDPLRMKKKWLVFLFSMLRKNWLDWKPMSGLILQPLK